MSAFYALRHFLTPYGVVLVVLIVEAVDVVVMVVVVVVVVETATESKLSFLIWGP